MLYVQGLQGQLYGPNHGLNPGLVALLLIACPPTATWADTHPSITWAAVHPMLTAIDTAPFVEWADTAPLLTDVDTAPDVEYGGC